MGWIITGLCGIAILNLGTIRKKDDPILRTQTEPISVKEKLEEIKDGEKGPPTPSFQLYPRNGFLTEPPFETGKAAAGQLQAKIPELGEPIPEDLGGTEELEVGDEWWAEEQTKIGEQEGAKAEGEKTESSETPDSSKKEVRNVKGQADEDWWVEEEDAREGTR
jgi:hypothetical protein